MEKGHLQKGYLSNPISKRPSDPSINEEKTDKSMIISIQRLK